MVVGEARIVVEATSFVPLKRAARKPDLAGFTQLEKLELTRATPRSSRSSTCLGRVTDAGLTHLVGLTKLKSVDLGPTRMTDAHLRYLVTDAGVQKLKKALPDCDISHSAG